MALLTPAGTSRPEALLFDLDDTIIDYSGGYERAWREAAQLACDAVVGLTLDALLPAIDASRDAFWDDPTRAERGRQDLRAASTAVVQGAFDTLEVEASPELARVVAERYRDRRHSEMSLFPEATRILQVLQAAGFRLGLVTNGSARDQRGKVERFALERYFEHIQIEGELGVGKPYPASYEHALGALDVAPAATWFIGDHIEWDVAAPQRHGMFGVWVSLGRPLSGERSGDPDHTIEGIGDLVDLV